ncbi:MAG: HAMP domain-containing histidine kinase [Actinomycetota bacterium]|nr:HAMP domain-containing histidine kinase [Actinomycetota bacterium]
MTLRARLALVTAAVAAIVVVTGVVVARTVARGELLSGIDASLVDRAADLGRGTLGLDGSRLQNEPGPEDPFGRGQRGFDALYLQAITADGETAAPSNQTVALPVSEEDLAVARGDRRRQVRSVDTDAGPMRLLTAQVGDGAIQVARSLDEFDQTMRGITLRLLVVGIGGVIIAGVLGLWVTRRALRPVDELTRTVEHVTATNDLDTAITVDRTDEVGRLAAGFNKMMQGLRRSRLDQERLVRDAGHELRTPLTALRTNIELLAKSDGEPVEHRRRLLAAATEEIEELSTLVSELVTLAADHDAGAEPMTTVDLGELAGEVVARFQRRSGRTITLDANGTVVSGRASSLERAISNLVDNALKWSPPQSTVRVSVHGKSVSVSDAGRGIGDADKPRVFDRFYRSTEARTTPGSGLGLAIVANVAEGHGGSVFVEDSPEGGATVGFRLPG